MQSINMPLITKLKLNTCEPYSIKYPIPFFDTKNSPIITPIKDIRILSFNVEKILSILDGITKLNIILNLLLPNDFNSLIL